MSFDPTIGRWISEDPIGFQAADPNLYRYAANNTTGATDPSGLFAAPAVTGTGGLQFTNVRLPKKADDKLEWVINWVAPPKSNGYIIQHVTIEHNYYELRTITDLGLRGMSRQYKCVNEKVEYWEAWKVIDGEVFVTSNRPRKDAKDVFSFSKPLGNPNWKPNSRSGIPDPPKSGYIKVAGSARFVATSPNLAGNAGLPGTGWGYEIPQAGVLIATKQRPPGWNDLGGIERSLTLTFNTLKNQNWQLVPTPTDSDVYWVRDLSDFTASSSLEITSPLGSLVP